MRSGFAERWPRGRGVRLSEKRRRVSAPARARPKPPRPRGSRASSPPAFLPSHARRSAIGALGPSLCAGPHCPEHLVDATMRVLSPVCCARPPHCPERRARRSAGQGGPRLSRGIGRPAPATCRSSVFKFSKSPGGALVSDCGSNAHFLNG